MNLDAVVARLDTVGIVAKDLFALLQLKNTPPQRFPVHFIVPDREAGQAKAALTGVHDQVVSCDFIVVTYFDPKASATPALIKSNTDALKDSLAGWAHPDAEGWSTEFVGGQLYELTDTRLGWFDKFRSRYRIRKTVTS